MKTVCILLIVLSLSGCSALGNLVDAGAKANDAAAVSAEVAICRGISIGAWVRAYGSDPAKAKAWRVLCDERLEALP